MDNGVISRQNSPENIRLLAAQRRLYSRAKRLGAVQVFAAGLTPVLGAIAVAIRPDLDVWAAFVGIVVSLLDSLWSIVQSHCDMPRFPRVHQTEFQDVCHPSVRWE